MTARQVLNRHPGPVPESARHFPNRHPGLVPGSTGHLSATLEPLVPGSPHGGSRHKAGMTVEGQDDLAPITWLHVARRFPSRHPGLVPGSTGPLSAKVEPLVQRSPHKAGMTMEGKA